ncbi:MAG: hypothetical protein ACJ761_05040 [Chloroflexota bacterium]
MSGSVVALLIGLVAVAAVTLVGSTGDLQALVTPPAIVRAALFAVFVVLGLWLLAQTATRLAAHAEPSGDPRDLPGMVRAVRLAFLAIAAFAAAAAWGLAHPLPLVVAAIIAGIDLVETSFLLLVVTIGSDDGSAKGPPPAN